MVQDAEPKMSPTINFAPFCVLHRAQYRYLECRPAGNYPNEIGQILISKNRSECLLTTNLLLAAVHSVRVK